ncbi:hypothetical protein QX776_03185 [Alteromonadaceae bacterium BrNp21-10]|nr:hypothetical protein [Alteromonadaceae bacterium BrNp21-10]
MSMMLWLGLCSSIFSLQLHANDFHFLYNSQLTLRSDYELDVLKLALETTKSEYGDFTIITRESGYTISRIITMAQASPEVILWASPYNPINTHLNIIEYPIFNGIFGLRSIVVHNNTLKNLNNVKTLSELREYTIGQGPGWMDVAIYKHHGFNVIEARLNKLFNMTANKRFDLLPLGRIEIDDKILSTKKGGDELSIAPNHMIYYPHPVLFHLNQKHKKAINRLNDGMQEITENGSLAALFEQHFSHVTAQLKQQDMTVFQLENNTLPTKYLKRMEGTQILKLINFAGE